MTVPRWTTPGTVAARGSIWAFVIYSLVQGAGIVIGGAIRWSGPSYTYLRETYGAPASWGWALVLLGLMLGMASLCRMWWLKLAALVGIATWALCFSVGAHIATAVVPTAGTTGGPVYLLTAVLAAILVVPDESRKVA